MKAEAGTSIGGRQTQGTIDPSERNAWLALAGVRGLGARRLSALVSHFGSALATLAASAEEISALPGFTPRAANLLKRVDPLAGEKQLLSAESNGQLLLTPPDPEYPAALRSIPDPPPILFVRGNPAILRQSCVAVIGSRDHSRYGHRVAQRIGTTIARAGGTVVSGMARGLDAVVQDAALRAGGTTVGVLGGGADVIYPRTNAGLFGRVATEGVLLSESPPGTRPSAGAFPRRNRIISGLSHALVVVEAAERSGTLITVGCALEQGREVLAVPGPIDAATSSGTNRLIREGATPIVEIGNLAAQLGLTDGSPIDPAVGSRCNMSPEETRVNAVLSEDPQDVDQIAERVGLPIGTLLGVLLGLEIGGWVERHPDGRFRSRFEI